MLQYLVTWYSGGTVVPVVHWSTGKLVWGRRTDWCEEYQLSVLLLHYNLVSSHRLLILDIHSQHSDISWHTTPQKYVFNATFPGLALPWLHVCLSIYSEWKYFRNMPESCLTAYDCLKYMPRLPVMTVDITARREEMNEETRNYPHVSCATVVVCPRKVSNFTSAETLCCFYFPPSPQWWQCAGLALPPPQMLVPDQILILCQRAPGLHYTKQLEGGEL